MKFIKAASFVLFLFPTLSISTSRDSVEIHFYMKEAVGPFSGEEDIEFYVYCDMPGYVTNCQAFLRYRNQNKLYASSTFKVGYVNSGDSTPCTLVLDGRMDDGGVNLTFVLENGPTYETFITKYECLSFNASKYKSEPLYLYNKFLFLNNNHFVDVEYFNFSNTSDYISIDKKNAFDFKELSFLYSPYLSFKAESAYLQIMDYENIYPKLHTGTNKLIQVPLEYTQTIDKISFTCKSDMYVNPTTLEMRRLPAFEFEKTNDFFVPLTKEEKMVNNQVGILLKGAGYDKSEIYIPLEFYDYQKLMGFCFDSDYCIVGGVKQWFWYGLVRFWWCFLRKSSL